MFKAEEIDSYNASASLYQTLESGADGQPGGILITSVGQEVIPRVWLGGYRALESSHFLKKNNITHILTLGHFKHCYQPNEFTHKIIPISDNPEANIIQYFPETTEFIENALKNGHNILVHCLAGVSRSPTVLTAYLMATQKLRWKAALALIKQTRPFVNPNPGFINQLRLFQEMQCQFDKTHPAYLEYLKQHPIDAGHIGHEAEYQR